jgi:hypothetical protein
LIIYPEAINPLKSSIHISLEDEEGYFPLEQFGGKECVRAILEIESEIPENGE